MNPYKAIGVTAIILAIAIASFAIVFGLAEPGGVAVAVMIIMVCGILLIIPRGAGAGG